MKGEYVLVYKYIINMEKYIAGNKEAWEEAFENRKSSYGIDIEKNIANNDYFYFEKEMIDDLKKYDLKGKVIGQFGCNNGRELLSLVKTTEAKVGIGFDIAENMVKFANEKAKKMNLPCTFIQCNILDIDDSYKEKFDMVIITIGALCWFKSLKEYFAVISKCMKKGCVIIINEGHPLGNMLAMEGDEEFDESHPLNCVFSYFSHEWIDNYGMKYMTGKNYKSKTFTNYTHSMSEIIGSMCSNGMVITNLQEFDYDISGNFEEISHKEIPLSMIIEGRKEN